MKAPRPAPTFFDNATTWVGSPASVIAHTAFFIVAFLAGVIGFAEWDMVLLVLTTLVSLEAIYLAIFIQMSVNRQARELEEVSEDIDEIQEDIDEIQEDVEEISEDVEEISEDVEDIQEGVEEMAEDDAPPPVEGVVVDATPGVDHVLAEVKKILKELEDLKAQLPTKPEPASEMPESVSLGRKIANSLKSKKPKPKAAKKIA
ncbi:MAG: DUF1003 domain-containing protein [Candidatus Pacebacteria bacterium]|nr:DUF1003 domain-containing protein [Candidatus Paceibacterota bacterium]MBP9840473.1 DUF1003 domain-containing protein [Candidatus Paceibacterota bacterium]